MRRLAASLLVLLLAAAPLAAQEPPVWVRTGLEWHLAPPPPEPVHVDAARVAEQIATGCRESPIRFADTAAMRGFAVGEAWREQVRDLASVAAFTDSAEDAAAALRQALATPDLTTRQTAVLENQAILAALQFGDRAGARALLAAHGLPAGLAGPLRADRLFWTVLTDADAAPPEAWRTTLLPQLDEALAADPASFQVRVWRVIGWLEGRGWTERPGCNAAIAAFSDRVLDLSEASACPLMIGHLAHAMDRHFGVRSTDAPAGELASWRRFATGLLAVVAGERATAAAMRNALAAEAGRTACAGQMAREVAGLERLP